MAEQMLRELIRRLRPDPTRHMRARDGLDLKLQEYLPRRGTFLEVGGYDGVTASNTYFLEYQMRWRGLLIEADPELYAKCVNARPRCRVIQTALVPADFPAATIDLQVLPADRSMSFVRDATPCEKASLFASADDAHRITVRATPLSEILRQEGINRIDFFSLDVEGYEAGVLRGVDFKAVRIDSLLVECLTNDALLEVQDALPTDFALVAQLTPRDYLFQRSPK